MAIVKPGEGQGAVPLVQPPSVGNGIGQTHSIPSGVISFDDLRAKRQLLVCAYGLQKSGKSDFALRTGPGDAYLVVLDPNSIEIAKKVQRETGRHIHYKDFQWGTRITGAESDGNNAALRLWTEIQEFMQWACSQGSGTIVFDTETQLKKLCDYAFVGQNFRMAQDVRIARAMLRNDAMRALINVIRDSNLSAFFLERMDFKWRDEKPTDVLENKGWSQLPYDITTVCHFWFDLGVLSLEPVGLVSPFQMKIGMHGLNPDYAGTEWYRGQPPEDDPDGGEMSFQKLLDLTFGPE